MEDGAEVADAIDSGDWEETVVIAEQRSEAAGALVRQVTSRIGVLEREQKPLCRAELVVAERTDGESCGTRELVARTLLTSLTAAGTGELTVVATNAGSEARDQLLGLVSSLLGELQSQAITIRVQFRRSAVEPAPKSGVRFTGTGSISGEPRGSLAAS
jgi:hypothetical protein